MMKNISFLFMAVLFSCCTSKMTWPDLPLAEVTDVFPEADGVETIDTSFYEVKNGDKVLGTILFSSPYSDAVIGYAGATPLRIVIDASGRIVEVKVLEHQESPGYFHRVVESGLFDSWNGLTPEQALSTSVDAVSGATYTSNGVILSLRKRLNAYQRQTGK